MTTTDNYYELRDKMKTKLAQVGIPYESIEILGSRIIITCLSRNTCEKWINTLSPRVAKFKKLLESIEHNKINTNTCLLPSCHTVWRVYFDI